MKKEDWLILAEKQLIKKGEQALTLDMVCKAAKKTKGSFYHHFENHSLFLQSVAKRWEEQQTTRLLKQVDLLEGSEQKLELLGQLVMQIDHRLELAIRRFGEKNKIIRNVVKKVDLFRIEFLTQMYNDINGNDLESAIKIAKIEYAAFLGSILLWPDKEQREADQLDLFYRNMVFNSLQRKDS